MKDSNQTAPRTKSALGLLTGGWKRWLLFGPLLLIAVLALTYFGQPVLAAAWRCMPVLLFVFACALALSCHKLTTRLKVAAGVVSALVGGYIFWSCGMMALPLIGMCAVSGLLLLVPTGKSALRILSRGIVALVGAWLVAVNAVPAFTDYQLAMHIVRNAEELDQFPVTVNDRNLPRSTAFEYSIRANEDRTREVRRVHLAWLPAGTKTTIGSADGSPQPLAKQHLVWQAPLRYNPEITANKFWNSFWGSVNGVIRVDGSDMKMRVDIKTGEDAYFMFGADSWVTDIIFRLRHPISTPAERIYWQKPDGSWVMLISYVTYKPTWTGTMIPVMDGVMEMGSYGGFSNHSPEAAREQFQGAALFPPELARKYGEAYSKFRLGLDDFFLWQQGLLEISEESRDGHQFPNSLPYFQNTVEFGPQLILPFEPQGGNANALARVLLFDATSGKIRGFSRHGGQIVNGPRTALENVHEAAPELDWQQYEKVEPLTIHTADDRWFYQVSVINNSKGQATVRIIVVDAVLLTPVAFKRVEDVNRYIEKGVLPADFRSLNGASTSGQSTAPAPAPVVDDQTKK